MWLGQLLDRKSGPKADPKNTRKTANTMLAAVIFSGLLALIYAGTFSRYLADDFCFSRLVIEHGFWGAQSHSYLTWSDRVSTVFVTSILDMTGVTGMQLLPGILITCFTTGQILLLLKLYQIQVLPITVIEVYILAGLCTFLTLYSAPSLFQSVFWRAGSVTYLMPLVILPFLFILLLHIAELPWRWVWIIVAGILFGFNGGFSETTLAMQAMVILIAGILVFIGRKNLTDTKPYLFSLLAAMLGTILMGGIMYASPGNSVRMTNLPSTPGLFEWVYLSLRYGLGFLYQSAISYPIPLAVAAVVGFCLAIQHDWKDISQKRMGWLFWGVPVTVFILVVTCCAPSAYAQSAYPEDRAMIGARWVMVIGILMWFYLLGAAYTLRRLRNPKYNPTNDIKTGVFVIVFCCIYLVYTTLAVLASIPGYQKRADAWDARTAEINQMRQNGQTDVQVTALDSVERIKEISDNPAHWVNKCAAVYYSVETITAK